jgi:hypothetical protein
MKFKVGERVRVVGSMAKNYPEVGTIIDIKGVGFIPDYEVSFTNYSGYVLFDEFHLEHYSDEYFITSTPQEVFTKNELEYIRRLVEAEIALTEELKKKLKRLENAVNS